MTDPQITHYFPPRIQLRRTKGWRMPQGAVKVDRTTIFGNPWVPGNPGRWNWPRDYRTGFAVDMLLDRASLTAELAVHCYREWLVHDHLPTMPGTLTPQGLKRAIAAMHIRRRAILAALPALRGKPLACWCKQGAPCHAHVLIDLANGGAP